MIKLFLSNCVERIKGLFIRTGSSYEASKFVYKRCHSEVKKELNI